jgi:hypothetical protein
VARACGCSCRRAMCGGWGWWVARWAAPTQAAGLTPPLPRASPPPGHAGGCASINAAPRPVPLPCPCPSQDCFLFLYACPPTQICHRTPPACPACPVPAELLPLLLRHVLQLPGPALRDGHRQHAPRNHAGGLPRSECRDSWRRGRGSGSQIPDDSSSLSGCPTPPPPPPPSFASAPRRPPVFAVLASPTHPAPQVTCLLVVNNALQGILSSFFYKYADTILKKYSSTIATIFTGGWAAGWVGRWVAMWVAMWVGGWVHQDATSDPPHTQPASCLPTPNPALCLNPPARPPLTAPPQA